MIFLCVHTVIQGGDAYCHANCRHTCDKGSKLNWREMWEIDTVSIMKEDFIEKDKDRSKYGWFTCSEGSIGSLLASSFF